MDMSRGWSNMETGWAIRAALDQELAGLERIGARGLPSELALGGGFSSGAGGLDGSGGGGGGGTGGGGTGGGGTGGGGTGGREAGGPSHYAAPFSKWDPQNAGHYQGADAMFDQLRGFWVSPSDYWNIRNNPSGSGKNYTYNQAGQVQTAGMQPKQPTIDPYWRENPEGPIGIGSPYSKVNPIGPLWKPPAPAATGVGLSGPWDPASTPAKDRTGPKWVAW